MDKKEITIQTEDNKKKYAEMWKQDSMEMNKCELYDWMCNKVKDYKNILEIGCGSGISTLNLLQSGHKVVCIESNEECIKLTKSFLNENGYTDTKIIKARISENNCLNILEKVNEEIDLIICWNPGGMDALTKKEIGEVASELIQNGYSIESLLTPNDIAACYAEDIQRSVCKMGECRKIDIHFIDREMVNTEMTNYYNELKTEYGYKKIIKQERETKGNKNTMGYDGKMILKSYLYQR